MGRHNPLFLFLILFVTLSFIATLILSTFANLGALSPVDWYNHTSYLHLFKNYVTDITPNQWTHLAWGVAFFWQATWIIFALVLTCAKNKDGKALYRNPVIISPFFLIMFLITLGICNAWLFMFDNGYSMWTLVLIVLMPVSLVIGVVDNCWRVGNRQSLLDLLHNHRGLLIANRIFVQNGIAFFITWSLVVTFLTVAIILQYEVKMEPSTSSIIAIGLLALTTFTWFIAENTFLERHVRYIFTPWLVLIWALCGSLLNNWEPEKISCLMSLVLICFAVFFGCFKKVLTLHRIRSMPLIRTVHIEMKDLDQ